MVTIVRIFCICIYSFIYFLLRMFYIHMQYNVYCEDVCRIYFIEVLILYLILMNKIYNLAISKLFFFSMVNRMNYE